MHLVRCVLVHISKVPGSWAHGHSSNRLIQSSGKNSLRLLRQHMVYCDTLAIVQVWQAESPKYRAPAKLCRKLFFLAAKNNFNVALKHLPGIHNCIADTLFRQQVLQFKQLALEADTEATSIPAWV